MDKPIGKDVEGYEVLTSAMKDLLNQYPGLGENETVKFEDIGEDSGIIFSNDSGALVFNEKEDICGTVRQLCQYPFFVIYRTTTQKEHQKINIYEFLDNFGKWACREPCVINGKEHILSGFPKLSRGREIKSIARDNPYCLEPNENGVQDWVLPLLVRYTNEYEKW